MTNLEIYNKSESCTVQINQAGIDEIKYIVEEYGNFDWVGDDSQIEAMSSHADGFDDNGLMNLELRSTETKSGNPYTYQLDIEEHFDVECL